MSARRAAGRGSRACRPRHGRWPCLRGKGKERKEEEGEGGHQFVFLPHERTDDFVRGLQDGLLDRRSLEVDAKRVAHVRDDHLKVEGELAWGGAAGVGREVPRGTRRETRGGGGEARADGGGGSAPCFFRRMFVLLNFGPCMSISASWRAQMTLVTWEAGGGGRGGGREDRWESKVGVVPRH